MDKTRRARLAAVIQQEISTLVSREVKDPRIPSVTFTQVEVAEDGSHAVIYVAILGAALAAGQEGPDANAQPDPKAEAAAKAKMKGCIEGLNSASNFMRRHLAKVLTVRHVPTLAFKEDNGFENSIRVQELLNKISQEK
jgi:ribosome-binding factor A